MSEAMELADLCGRHIGQQVTIDLDGGQVTGKLDTIKHDMFPADRCWVNLTMGKVHTNFSAPSNSRVVVVDRGQG